MAHMKPQSKNLFVLWMNLRLRDPKLALLRRKMGLLLGNFIQVAKMGVHIYVCIHIYIYLYI